MLSLRPLLTTGLLLLGHLTPALAAPADAPAATSPTATEDTAVVADAPASASPAGPVVAAPHPLPFAAPSPSRPLRVAIYRGPGAPQGGADLVARRARRLPGLEVTELLPAEVATRDLSAFDVIAFTGGSGSAQAKAIGPEGRAAVRQFVDRGGGYLGICAGAYLACAGFDWGIGVLNARTVSPKWRRGRGAVTLELSADGHAVFGPVEERFQIRYANGPIIRPLGRADLPAYTVAAWFRTELAENDSPVGAMIDSPAVVCAPYGRGRVVTISPHPEGTRGLEDVIPLALVWLTSAPAAASLTSTPPASLPTPSVSAPL